jgi:hypothetical protein
MSLFNLLLSAQRHELFMISNSGRFPFRVGSVQTEYFFSVDSVYAWIIPKVRKFSPRFSLKNKRINPTRGVCSVVCQKTKTIHWCRLPDTMKRKTENSWKWSHRSEVRPLQHKKGERFHSEANSVSRSFWRSKITPTVKRKYWKRPKIFWCRHIFCSTPPPRRNT